MTKSLQQLEDQILEALQERDDDGAVPTDSIKTIADAVVEARLNHFMNAEGKPDLKGSTFAYRRWLGDTLREAQLSAEQTRKVMASVRYHGGVKIREKVSPEDLEDAGLLKASPRDRSLSLRHEAARTVSLFGAGMQITKPEEVLAGLRSFERFTRRVKTFKNTGDPEIEQFIKDIKKNLNK